MMKRTWMVVAVLTVALMGGAAIAQAQTNQTAGAGRGRMGMGAGMMQGGRGQMGNHAAMMQGTTCTGENYDPAAGASRMAGMIAQHQAQLERLNAQLAQAADEATKAALASRIERQEIVLAWQQGRLPVVQAAATEWPAGAITMAEYDVNFFRAATATNAENQDWIANRLVTAEGRLAQLQAQK